MSEYYDKNGKPLDFLTWVALTDKQTEPDYFRVAETTTADGKWISTVWIGLNHNFGEGPPLIFETMVFPNEHDFRELDMDRYATLEEAQQGHRAMVEKWSGVPRAES